MSLGKILKKIRKEEPYPCTIIMDRYSSAYSGGKWLAFNLHNWNLPSEIYSSDVPCLEFWHGDASKEYPIGRGDSPEEAYKDLTDKLAEKV